MKSLFNSGTVAAALSAAALFASQPAQAGFDISVGNVGVHIGPVHHRVIVPAYYYGPGYYPPGPCDEYDSYYAGDCGYAVYTGRVFINGVWVTGPHYYRWYDGAPLFWYRGAWVSWPGWVDVNFGWNHFEGWGWSGGHWDRGWGVAHGGWHGPVRARDVRELHEDRDLHHDHEHTVTSTHETIRERDHVVTSTPRPMMEHTTTHTTTTSHTTSTAHGTEHGTGPDHH